MMPFGSGNTKAGKETTIRQMVVEADPEWPLYSQLVQEYTFSAPKGERIFSGRYAERGPYASD